MRFYEVGGGVEVFSRTGAVHHHYRLHHRLLDHHDLADQQCNEVGDDNGTVLTQALVHPSPPGEVSRVGLGWWINGIKEKR